MAKSLIAKLYGGPFDGELVTVMEDCHVLRFAARRKLWAFGNEPVEPGYVSYRRSAEDPNYFIYEGKQG